MDTRRRLQDHDLTLLPQSHFKFHLGYSRNDQTGPALSTVQEFDASGLAYPVFMDVRREWNEYRLGADAEFAGFKFTVLRRWDFYKDDSAYNEAIRIVNPLRWHPVLGLQHSRVPSLSTAPTPAGSAISSPTANAGASMRG